MRSTAQPSSQRGAAPPSALSGALPRIAALVAVALGAGCASGAAAPHATAVPSATAQAPSGGAPGRPSGGPEARRELSPKAQRLFDDAVATAEEQKRLKVPTDWEILERRWRAVTEVEAVPEAYFNLGVALEHRGRLDEARAAYRRASDLEPRFAAPAVNLALLDEPGDPAQAAQRWTELLRRFPDEPVPRVRLAALYETSSQYDEAWRLAREALMRDPTTVGAYKVMMRVALARDRLDLAQLLAVKARKLDETDPEIVSFVGDVDRRQNDEAGAVAQWKKAIAMKDDYLPARYALLAHALGKQQWQSVSEQAAAILRSNPSDARVHLVLGIAYRHLGQPDKALAAYADAERASSGKLPEVYLARGVLLMKSKEQCEPALAELKRYLLAAGPAMVGESAAPRLERECEQILVASRQAEEAAREMKAQARREADRKAAEGTSAKPEDAKPGAAGGAGPNGQTVSPAPTAAADPAPDRTSQQAVGMTPPDKSDRGTEDPTR